MPHHVEGLQTTRNVALFFLLVLTHHANPLGDIPSCSICHCNFNKWAILINKCFVFPILIIDIFKIIIFTALPVPYFEDKIVWAAADNENFSLRSSVGISSNALVGWLKLIWF